MPDFNGGFATGRIDISSDDIRAMLAWRRIERNPTGVRLYRDGAYLPEQTVRIEHNKGASNVREDEISQGSERGLIVFGVRGHPLQADTDIAVGDRFVLPGETRTYQVEDVLNLPGEVQAKAVVTDG